MLKTNSVFRSPVIDLTGLKLERHYRETSGSYVTKEITLLEAYRYVRVIGSEAGSGTIAVYVSDGTEAPESVSAYNGGTAYAVGDIRSYGDAYWQCIQAGTGQTPAVDSAYWAAVEDFEGDDVNDDDDLLWIRVPVVDQVSTLQADGVFTEQDRTLDFGNTDGGDRTSLYVKVKLTGSGTPPLSTPRYRDLMVFAHS